MNRIATTACAAVLAVGLTTGLAACGSSDDGGDKQVLRVLAASSLTDVFGSLEKTFEAQHPDVDVQVSYGSSTDLAGQAVDGAPGDVLATAAAASMQIAVKGKVAVDGRDEFATNVLVIATKAGNPEHIRSLADLDGKTWVRCASTAPCGKVADAVLKAQHVTAQPKSEEVDVRSTLDKLTSGEADAALVYATDAKSAGSDVTAVSIPGAKKAQAEYFISPLTQSKEGSLARRWIQLVTGPQGREVLTKAGFGTK